MLLEHGQLDSSVLASLDFALAIFQLDDRCDCLVHNMNGRVPDEGGTFEAAVAFGLGKPVVLYKRDHRTELYGQDNAMITGLSHDFSAVTSADELPGRVRQAIARYPGRGGASGGGPPYVRLSVELGRAVWELLEESGAHGTAGMTGLGERLAALYDTSSLKGILSQQT
jgi:hypothetical protein